MVDILGVIIVKNNIGIIVVCLYVIRFFFYYAIFIFLNWSFLDWGSFCIIYYCYCFGVKSFVGDKKLINYIYGDNYDCYKVEIFRKYLFFLIVKFGDVSF